MTNYTNPQYEYEMWLLPYKPLNMTTINASIVRDSKNRRIVTSQELYAGCSEQSRYNVQDGNRVSHSNNNTNRNTHPDPSSNLPCTSAPASHMSTPLSHTNTPVSYTSTSLSYTSTPESQNVPDHNIPSSRTIPGFVNSLSSVKPPLSGSMMSYSQWKVQETKRVGAMCKLNTMKQRFNKAEPVNSPKVMSMMLKMGWSGGGLGRTGEGIKEPIVPNMDYAVENKGFGQPEPVVHSILKPNKKPAKQKKLTKAERRMLAAKDPAVIAKRQYRDLKKKLFGENLLRSILNFVTNEREIAIVFDKKLHNGLRKYIHRIVEEIREMCQLQVECKMNEGCERLIMMDIVKRNRYVLQTQSEGEIHNRFLSIFKEAPPSMYLVTHFQMNDKENDIAKKREIVDYRFKSKSKMEKFFRDHGKNKRYEIVQELRGNIVCRVFENSNSNRSEKDVSDPDEENTESGNEFDETDNLDECGEEIAVDEPTKVDENNHIKTNGITEEITEINEKPASGAFEIKADESLKTNLTGSKNEDSQTKNDKFNTIEPNNENDDINIKSEENVQATKTLKINEEIMEIDEKTNVKKDRKTFLRHNLNNCFSNFISGDVFREFKFLGEFDEEEFEVMNEFLKDFFLVKSGNPALDVEFADVWNVAKCKLAYKRDVNGGIMIYKVS